MTIIPRKVLLEFAYQNRQQTMSELKNKIEKITTVEIDRNTKSRVRPEVIARQYFAYIWFYLYRLPLEELGPAVGKDHASIIHMREECAKFLREKSETDYRETFLKILECLER